MCGDDAAADRQPEADTEGLVRHERLEDTLELIGRNALAAVGDGDDDLPVVRFRPKRQPPLAGGDIGHRLASIDGQVQQELLQLHAIAVDQRQTGLDMGDDRNVAADKIAVQQAKNLADELVQVERLPVRFTTLE